jgi:hypothetical protein
MKPDWDYIYEEEANNRTIKLNYNLNSDFCQLNYQANKNSTCYIKNFFDGNIGWFWPPQNAEESFP